MGYWKKRVFVSILLGILFSILFASAEAVPPTGYIIQEPYSGICDLGQYQGLMCIVFSDGYVWLLPGNVRNSGNIQEDGKNVQVFAGTDLRYYHILNTNFVKIDSLMTQATQGYFEQKSYSEDCDARPFGTVCIVYSDGYILLVTDSVKGWEKVQEDGKNVQVAVGNNARYYHIPNPNLVKIDSLMTQATQGYAEQKSYSGDCVTRTFFGTVCLVYSDGYIWRVTDYVQSWEEAREDSKNVQVADSGRSREEVREDGKNVQVAVGNNAHYYHILNPNFVKIGPLITQAAPEPAPEPAPATKKVPDWIKNNAKWWAEGKIADNDFVKGIEFLVSSDIISLPKTEDAAESQTEQVKPLETKYIKLNADEFALPSTRGLTTEVMVNGYVEDYSKASPVYLIIENPNGEIEKQKLIASGGDYYTRIYLQRDSQVGEYKITIEYNKVNVDTISFVVIDKSSVKPSAPEPSAEIPSWIKNNAGWWADGLITEDDFVKGLQYLVEQGIIKV